MYSYCFFFNDTSTTEIYTLSLHDALPIYIAAWNNKGLALFALGRLDEAFVAFDKATLLAPDEPEVWRSEEHTSELQSHSDLVCRLLLEKKKIQTLQNAIKPHDHLPQRLAR